MDGEEKAGFEKRPNGLAFIPAFIFGPLSGVLLTGGIVFLVRGAEAFSLFTSGAVVVAYIVTLLCIPTAIRYQREKPRFVLSCSIFGAVVAAVIALFLIYFVAPPGFLPAAGLFLVIVVYGGISAAMSAFLYKFFIKLLVQLQP